MDNSRIRLTSYEYQMARRVGLERQTKAVENKRVPRNGMKQEDGWKFHVEGACGEAAAAKFLNVFFSGSVEIFTGKPDLEPNIEVKTRSSHSYDLLIRKHEDLSQVFVLVTGTAPDFWIRGWGIGSDLVSDEYLQSYGNRPAAWFIPVGRLSTDWTELKKTYIWR
jgi:hypothetical protein